MAAFRVTVKVEAAPGEPWRPTVLDFGFEVAGVPAHEVISVLMAAAARILVTPVSGKD